LPGIDALPKPASGWARMLMRDRRLRRWGARIAVGLAGLVALAVASGSAYEAFARRQLAARYPLPGRLIDIGGRRLQLDCRGTGSPTVVFETGFGTGGALDWQQVQDPIAETTRACSYSRAGILGSDPGVGERDANAVAEDLHTLLDRAGERPPLVLVAHSLGGIYTLTYTGKFGSDVAGLVLVDTLHPDSMQRMVAAGLHLPDPRHALQVARLLAWTGLLRLLGDADPESAYTPGSVAGMYRESEALDHSLAEAGAFRQLGSRPLYVLTAGKIDAEFLSENQLTPEQGAQFLAIKRSLNEDKASWSSHSQHEFVAESRHRIQEDQPERVISATRWVVAAVRAGAAP
jgi:pimeloyl-ACP methyl ester carboxylesterase